MPVPSRARASVAAGCVGFLVAACQVTPPQIPTPQQIVDFGQQLTRLGSDPIAIVDNGYAYVDKTCGDFFNALEQARNENALTVADLAAAAAAAASLMTILKAGAQAIGVTAALFGLVSAGVANYAQFILLTQYHAELQDLVRRAQEEYKKTVANNPRPTPLTVPQAYSVVIGYGKICTLSSIDYLARQAIASAKTSATAAPPLNDAQLAQLRGIGWSLGLPNTVALNLDQAAAIILYHENQRDAKIAALVKDKFGSSFELIFLPQGALLTPKDPGRFEGAYVILSGMQQTVPALALRVQQLRDSLTAGAVQMPHFAPTEFPLRSLGVAIPNVEVTQ